MKKTIVALLLCLFFASQLSAQDYKIGVKIGPTLSYARTSTESDDTEVDRNSTDVKFLVGAFIDYEFKENYFFHTGLSFASKNTDITADSGALGGPVTESYDHEYLQIPALLKLYTNEVLLDTKVFFNFGVMPEVRLKTKEGDNVTVKLVEKFRPVDLSGTLGGGVEKRIGTTTSISVGLNYNIGFFNMVKDRNDALDEFSVKSNLLALEFAIKF
ncbi:outer membrane protein with beta-barrel domain [Roseivirga pacifica]|uniref:Outer membrane protein beta-barrel domain-containing protein n=1 Tax=Roseivirga pacifica TaxID=1267423 RepID=A0A1I0MEN0_9BACT|nr:porin family protein [Roseivirga pacifica]MCO6358874.1 outer membrane beta-barrel protein [Roseivirga pacifica]MCO6365490.1 outer membrane beta-barrel protein [Roseivirga pacifica]MCO6371780.1 outer membrane beta-barrel protein [Roseivirga pacifica]MCO6376109.1 outer membrane beta-barrel protein [Roseivirga pacifica]MCO6379158.1 outer membrane beta-barrel protein [Roseivirga pacifica]